MSWIRKTCTKYQTFEAANTARSHLREIDAAGNVIETRIKVRIRKRPDGSFDCITWLRSNTTET